MVMANTWDQINPLCTIFISKPPKHYVVFTVLKKLFCKKTAFLKEKQFGLDFAKNDL